MAKPSASTQQFIPIKDIRNASNGESGGVVVLKDGGLRKVLLVSSVNFALKGQEEQMGILLQFQNFLNSLDFSVQIVAQSRKFDIAPYLSLLRERIDASENDLIKIQVREYIQFIQNYTSTYNVMSKTFFVIVPYAGAVIPTKASIFGSFFKGGKEEEAKEAGDRFEEQSQQLDQRVLVVKQGLESCGLRAMVLSSELLIELFYKSFNPDEPNRGGMPENTSLQ